jgi:hypothetical protein
MNVFPTLVNMVAVVHIKSICTLVIVFLDTRVCSVKQVQLLSYYSESLNGFIEVIAHRYKRMYIKPVQK